MYDKKVKKWQKEFLKNYNNSKEAESQKENKAKEKNNNSKSLKYKGKKHENLKENKDEKYY